MCICSRLEWAERSALRLKTCSPSHCTEEDACARALSVRAALGEGSHRDCVQNHAVLVPRVDPACSCARVGREEGETQGERTDVSEAVTQQAGRQQVAGGQDNKTGGSRCAARFSWWLGEEGGAGG